MPRKQSSKQTSSSDPETEARRQQLARRSWALAEMYLQPLFPPVEKQLEMEALHNLWLGAMDSMRAAGLPYEVARRIYLGLPPSKTALDNTEAG